MASRPRNATPREEPEPRAKPTAKESVGCETPFPNDFLALGGTLVLTDPSESVALIHVHGSAGTPVRKGDLIGTRKFVVVSIERMKACVRSVESEALYLLVAHHLSPSDRRTLGNAVGIE